MTFEELLPPLAAVGLGWFLNELSHRLRLSAVQKGAAGRALADLLEIRHYLHSVHFSHLMLREVEGQHPLSEGDRAGLSRTMKRLIPADAELPQRYGRAITEIAEVAPLLAFRLRSRDQIPDITATIDAFRLSDGQAARLPDGADDFMLRVQVETLDESIRAIAWKHGVATWVRIRRELVRKPRPIAYLDQLADMFEKSPPKNPSVEQ